MPTEWIRRAGVCVVLVATAGLVSCKKEPPAEETPSEAPPSGGAPAAAAITAPEVTYSTDQQVIDKGKELFTQKGCNACHKIGGGKLVGPDLKGVTARRDKQWIAKMILHPDLMLKQDPIAMDLFKTYLTPMPKQGVTDQEIGPLMSYLKANE